MDSISRTAILLNGLLIFTTVQTQDFSDVDGDAALGRVTLPIYAPELSRIFTLFAMILWSSGLVWFWGIGLWYATGVIIFGTAVGLRFYMWRQREVDQRSYIWFNVSFC